MRKNNPSIPDTIPRKRRRVTWYIVIAVCLALFVAANIALIYYFSAENREASANRSNDISQMIVDFLCPDFYALDRVEQHVFMTMMRKVIRKVAHFCEFALLGFLSGWFMLHLHRRRRRIRLWMTWVFPAVFCIINAALDEIHQIFSERGPSVRDVLIDVSGALFGLCLVQLLGLVIFLIRRACGRTARKACDHDAERALDTE